ncbi:alpha/beta fold hydrolase [Streptomyces sp. NPDC056465]|uniref:alpha/beta fold hydrolase n=1 Tax=unclassified Streptomyces TaxID=2593676 RepID=UPI0035DEE01C
MTGTDERADAFVRTDDGVSVAYQRRGTGIPLVLLAGQANNHHWWDGVREDFHPARSTVTLDYRGTGASDAPREGYSTPRFAEDVVCVLDALGLERADVYGTSMGGRVAQWVAARHPDRVRHLVLGCTSPGGPLAVERDASVRRALAGPDPDAVRRTLTELMYTPGWTQEHPGPYGTLGDPHMPPHARNGHLTASNRHDAWDVLPRITAPTLILHGGQDRLTPPENAALLAERIPDARVHLLPGARHAYFEECRDTAGALVRAFLA